MAVTAAVAIGGLALSGYKYFKGRSDDKKAKAEAERAKHPFYKIQDEYNQNKNLTEQLATGGLPAGTKDYLDIERKRGLSSELGALQETGADEGLYEKVMGSYNQSLGQEASADAEQHIANIGYFMSANKDLAAQKNIQYGVNELQPFENKLKEITERRSAAQQNQMNALSEGVSAISSYATATSNSSLMKKLFGNSDPYSKDAKYTSINQDVQHSNTSIDTSRNLPELNSLDLQFQ